MAGTGVGAGAGACAHAATAASSSGDGGGAPSPIHVDCHSIVSSIGFLLPSTPRSTLLHDSKFGFDEFQNSHQLDLRTILSVRDRMITETPSTPKHTPLAACGMANIDKLTCLLHQIYRYDKEAKRRMLLASCVNCPVLSLLLDTGLFTSQHELISTDSLIRQSATYMCCALCNAGSLQLLIRNGLEATFWTDPDSMFILIDVLRSFDRDDGVPEAMEELLCQAQSVHQTWTGDQADRRMQAVEFLSESCASQLIPDLLHIVVDFVGWPHVSSSRM